jgi:hypothetical protein
VGLEAHSRRRGILISKAGRIVTVLFVIVLISACFSFVIGGGYGGTSSVNTKAVKPMTLPSDAIKKTPSQPATQPYQAANPSTLSFAAPGRTYEIGDKASYYVGDYGKWWYNETDPSGFMPFTKRAEGNMSELWTCDDMTFFPGDYRNNISSKIDITNEQAEYMVKQFDDVIYPRVSSFAGPAPPRDGENSIYKSAGLPYFSTNVTGRVMIMVLNMYDGAFWYDMDDSHYMLGYYDPTTAHDYDRNIIQMDNWDWTNRTGQQATQFSGNYTYMLESILAHEYQHIINDYYNAVQDSFLSEGCSELAPLVCGYSMNFSRFSNYIDFMSMPDNSLTEWLDQGAGGEMADYASSGLFIIYLYDHFGPDFIHDLIVTNLTGILAVNNAFILNGHPDWNFDRVFNAWRLANLIRSDTPGNGLYNYKSIDLNSPDFGNIKVQDWDPTKTPVVDSAARYFGTTKTWYDYDTGISKLGSYGTDYIHVSKASATRWSDGLNPNGLTLNFNGDDMSYKGWQVIKQPIALTGQNIYRENFDHDGSLPGWAMKSTGTLTLHPWYLQQETDGNYFAVANAAELGWYVNPEMREYLYMTSGFSTVGYTDIGLQMTIDCQLWGMSTWGDFARVLCSVDGGSTWNEVVNYSTTSTNAMGDLPFQNHANVIFDLSFASGYEDVRLAFDYSSYNIGLWCAIDDVRVGPLISQKMWWSGNGDQVDYKLTADLDLTDMTHAILSFDTLWKIEDGWDFGFVQVSDDGGNNWTSVANEHTTNEAGYGAWPEAVANLPGITGESPFPGYGQVTYDLSAWTGEVIKLRFRYITDWGVSLDGWFIDNIRLNGRLLDNANDIKSFASDIPPKDIDWMVTIYLPGCIGPDGICYLPIISNLRLNDLPETVMRYLGSMTVYADLYIIISPTVGPADYSFGVINSGT